MRAMAWLSGVLWIALGGCVPVAAPVPSASSLRQIWLIGIERMRNDPEPSLPFTNRFLFDLAAMPNVQVVYLNRENALLFAFDSVRRIRVAPWLRGEGNCMTLIYTPAVSGQQSLNLGAIVGSLPAGTEFDSACVDRAATEFYYTLIREGF